MSAVIPIRTEPAPELPRAVDPAEPEDALEGHLIPIWDGPAEGVVLAALLRDEPAGCYARVSSTLRPEHFFATSNQHVYSAIVALHGQPGAVVDVVSVMGWMKKRGTLGPSGGSPYLAILTDTTPACANVAVHAATVVELWAQRQLLACMQRVAWEMRAGRLDHVGARRELAGHFRGGRP